MHPPPRQGARTDRRELLAVQSRALITVTERSRDRSGERAERSASGGGAVSGQHVPEAAAAERGPARRQAGAVARVVPPPLLHDVHCVFRPICVHGSWRWWRCILPSILGISLVAWLAWLVGPGGIARVGARRAPRLLCIGWVRGSGARAGVRWRIIVAHVGGRICPAKERNKQNWFAFVCSSTTT